MNILRPDLQPSPFRSWPTCFEMGWPYSWQVKSNGLLQNQLGGRLQNLVVDTHAVVTGWLTCWFQNWLGRCWHGTCLLPIWPTYNICTCMHGSLEQWAMLIRKDCTWYMYYHVYCCFQVVLWWTSSVKFCTFSPVLKLDWQLQAGRPVSKPSKGCESGLNTYINLRPYCFLLNLWVYKVIWHPVDYFHQTNTAND